jgi:hypothetical protein
MKSTTKDQCSLLTPSVMHLNKYCVTQKYDHYCSFYMKILLDDFNAKVGREDIQVSSAIACFT